MSYRCPYNCKNDGECFLKGHLFQSEKKTRFEEIGTEIGRLVHHKNIAYGDSFAKCGAFLTLLYPHGIQPEQYQDALCVTRVFDKLMRVATARDALGESPWRDIAGYSILALANEGPRPGEVIPVPKDMPPAEFYRKLGERQCLTEHCQNQVEAGRWRCPDHEPMSKRATGHYTLNRGPK